MYDVNYKKWADYIEEIFKINGVKPSLIADLGCGTGSFCIEMDKRGYDMIGIDLSPDMLDCAKKKSEGRDILYLNQDMSNFELYGTVDAIVCLMDSVKLKQIVRMLTFLQISFVLVIFLKPNLLQKLFLSCKTYHGFVSNLSGKWVG